VKHPTTAARKTAQKVDGGCVCHTERYGAYALVGRSDSLRGQPSSSRASAVCDKQHGVCGGVVQRALHGVKRVWLLTIVERTQAFDERNGSTECLRGRGT
jgi:hypothetical protein